MAFWRDFLLAIGFFTRIPVPDHPNFSEQALARSALYFPLVGVIVGALIVVFFHLFYMGFPAAIAVILALSVGFLITGGFHEDGWADTFDGLGGAFDKERKLAIMTDSRLGTYGSLALWSLLTLKVFTLAEITVVGGLLIWIFAHGFSRWCAMSAMIWLPYVRTDASKSKPIVQQLSLQRWLSAGLILIPFFLLLPTLPLLLVIGICGLAVGLALLFLKRQIGGYTGDTLGAIQQGIELLVLLLWLFF